ncbi:MAG TPA: YCF48-related protein [Burkholderiaceae bacterium]|jgi:photosystem II stability/assembly factor-like uncharacterized protein
MQKKNNLRSSAAALALLASMALSACGGGGGSSEDSTPPPPTAIPDSLAISAPANADMASALKFSSAAGSLSGLNYSWDFGDGSTSTDAAPSHSYTKSGDFKITLHVTNTAGASKDAQYSLSINNTALTQGLACSGAKQSGWCWEQPTPSGADRYDTFFIDANTGWTVGANGTILKTVDGGTSWQSQASGVTVGVRSVRFANANKGWAMADYGALLQTSDGGATWSVSKTTNGYSTDSLQVLDANTVLFRDSYGNVVTSTNGGQTWQTVQIVPQQISKSGVMWVLTSTTLSKSTDLGQTQVQVLDLRPTDVGTYANISLQRSDDQHLFVTRSSQGYVGNTYVYKVDYWRSQDGGATWDTPAMQGLPGVPAGNTVSIVYASPGALFASVGSTLYRSEDVGGTWSPVNAGFANYYYYSGNNLYSVSDTELVYYQYGQSSSFISTDSGKTWAAMTSPGTAGSYYYGSIKAQLVGAQGVQLNFSDGSSYRSMDLGKTWTTVLGPTVAPSTSQLHAFWAFDALHVLGLDGNGNLLESKDGGRSWTVKQTGLYAGSGQWISFVSAKVGWLFLGDGHLYRTTDGGQTWSAGLSSNFFNYYNLNFQFLDENVGVVANNGRLSQTKDGGNSWLDVGPLPSNSTKVRFQSATHGVAFGSSGLFETSDGGLTWAPRFTGVAYYINAVVYADANTAWASDSSGNLLKSTDGGTTWQRSSLSVGNTSLFAIQFLDPNHGWIVGSTGTIIATSDGGSSWQAQTAATSRNLQQVQFVDSRTGWILGDSGALLTTGTGGN